MKLMIDFESPNPSSGPRRVAANETTLMSTEKNSCFKKLFYEKQREIM